MPRALVLSNPRSRAGGHLPVRAVLDAFALAGWEAEARAGVGLAWARRAVDEAVSDHVDAVFGAGGDGLLHHMLPSLIGTPTALGVIPLGTGNVWARTLKLPLQPAAAVAAQLAAGPRAIDIGRANGTPFLVIASVGVDAEIARRVESGPKALGQIAYPLVAVQAAGIIQGSRCQIQVDDHQWEDWFLSGLATNGPLYGGVVTMAPRAKLDDGLLDIVLFFGRTAPEALAHATRVALGTHALDRRTFTGQARYLRIQPLEGALPCEADGEPLSDGGLEVTVEPGALRVLGA